MIAVNPDLHAKRYHFSPVHRVRGLFTSCDNLPFILQCLAEAGISDDEIEVFVGEEGVQSLDSTGSYHNIMIRLLRNMESMFFSDDTEIHAKTDRLLQSGGCVVDVLTRGKSEKKAPAAQALKNANADEVIYWGHMYVEWL